jgi:hypothetical protein
VWGVNGLHIHYCKRNMPKMAEITFTFMKGQ